MSAFLRNSLLQTLILITLIIPQTVFGQTVPVSSAANAVTGASMNDQLKTAPAFVAPSSGTSPLSMAIPGTIPGNLQGATIPPNMQQLMQSGQLQKLPLPASPEGATAPSAVTPPPTAPSKPAGTSEIEKAMMPESRESNLLPSPQKTNSAPLEQFGYSFFRPDTQGFAPLVDAPVGPEYLIGAGDRFVVSIWGSLEGSYELEVNRSGEIVLPKVGPVKVAGVPYGKLVPLLKGHLGKVLKDFNLSVSMGKLRMIKVYVVGQVSSPGDYFVSSLSTVINALSAAGGPTKQGSLRSVVVRRDGVPVNSVDLYDFFLKGDKSSDIRLQAGDTIYVPAIGPVAGIGGNVRRPAIYELKGEKNLKELITLADGIIPTGYLQRLQIFRVAPHNRMVMTDVNLDPQGSSDGTIDQMAAKTALQDMDLVKIFPIDSTLRGFVRLDGYVLRPGDYALKPGMKISHLLTADNILPEFYRDAGEITRLVPPDLHPEKIFFNPGKALSGAPENDLLLQEFDTVKVYSRWEMEEMPTVRIGGDVQKPGTYRLFDNMRVKDLLILAGNPKLTAYLENAEINRLLREGNKVSSFPLTINLKKILAGDHDSNLLLQPFDEMTIRRIPNWGEETDRYITLKGEFVFPGVYPVYRGEKLSSVIERAGGFTDKAYLFGAKFTRLTLQQDQQKRMDEILSRAEQDLVKKQAELAGIAASKEELEATKAALEGLQRNIAMLKQKKAEGRMVIKLQPLQQFARSQHDIEINGGDTLYVPEIPRYVSVFGEVFNPTAFIYENSLTVSDYLEKCGGVTGGAEPDESYVIKADGSVISHQNMSSFLFYDKFGDHETMPGDTIVVPQRIERTAWLRDVKDVTTILAQLAIAAGTVILGLK